MSESKCPVCAYALDAAALNVRIEGRDIAVCCEECAEQLKAMPKKYLGVGGLA